MAPDTSSTDRTSNPPTALDVCLSLARADAELRRRFDRVLSAHYGLSLNDFTLLRALDDAPARKLRRVDLAEHLGITASGATRLLAPLEKVGLVRRHANPDDARVALTELTDAGQRLVADARTTAEEIGADLLAQRFTEDEVATLGRLLARLCPPAL